MLANIALGSDVLKVQKQHIYRSPEDQVDGESVEELEYLGVSSIENRNATYHGHTKYSARPPIHIDFKSGQTPTRRKSSTTSCESDYNNQNRDAINEEMSHRMANTSAVTDSTANTGYQYRYHRRSSSNSSNVNPMFKPDDEDFAKNRLESQKTSRPTTLDLNSDRNLRKQYNVWHNQSISPIQSSPDSYYDLSTNSPSSPTSVTPQRTVRFNFANAHNSPQTSNNSYATNAPKPTLMDAPADGQQLDGTIPLTAILGNRKPIRKRVENQFYKGFNDYL